MKLADFLWPYPGADLKAPILELTERMKGCDLEKLLTGAGGNLAEACALEGRFWNINPRWLAVCMQREQSAFTKSLAFWQTVAICGFVGKDVGRVDRPGYYGAFLQVARCAEQSAWLLGVKPLASWEKYSVLSKKVPRWPGRDTVLKVKNDTTGEWGMAVAKTAEEYLQLNYTPHSNAMATNQNSWNMLFVQNDWLAHRTLDKEKPV